MKLSANLVIIQLLHTESDPTDFLRLCWDKLSSVQKKQVFHFLYLAKQNRTFLTLLRHELNAQLPIIPWTHLFAILLKLKKVNSENIVDLINPESSSSELGQFRVAIPSLENLWESRKRKVQTEYLEKKAKLLNDLDFAKNQGLREKRAQILEDLKKLFPQDKDILFAIHSEREYQARNTLHKMNSKRNQSTLPHIEPRAAKFEQEKALLTVTKKVIKKNKKLTLDLAIAFWQMDQYELALQVLDLINNKPTEVLWYELQICIEHQQFARALSLISSLKQEKLTSELSFSLLYYQALSLHGLGKASEAITILKKIIKIRPNFKSASSLLLEWESE